MISDAIGDVILSYLHIMSNADGIDALLIAHQHLESEVAECLIDQGAASDHSPQCQITSDLGSFDTSNDLNGNRPLDDRTRNRNDLILRRWRINDCY